MPDVEDEDALYGLDPSEFVAARNALARRLRAQGDKERAALVTKLKRPPKSAWALNVLAREDPDAVAGFLDAATSLAEAFGSGGDQLREAQSSYRRALDSTVDAAAGRSGLDGDVLRERMRSTLSAAASDEELAATLRGGVLHDDHEAPGFAIGSGWATELAKAAPRERPAREPGGRSAPSSGSPSASPGTSEPTRSPESGAADHEDGAEQDEAGAAVKARERSAREAEEAAQARRAAIRQRRQLERQLDTLRRRVERLERTASEAEERALTARRDADDAAEELAELEQQLQALGGGGPRH